MKKNKIEAPWPERMSKTGHFEPLFHPEFYEFKLTMLTETGFSIPIHCT